jgi:hypothetical protein
MEWLPTPCARAKDESNQPLIVTVFITIDAIAPLMLVIVAVMVAIVIAFARFIRAGGS